MPKDKQMQLSAITIEKMRLTCPKCGKEMDASLDRKECVDVLFPCECLGCGKWWGDSTDRYELWGTFDELRDLRRRSKKMRLTCPKCGKEMDASLNSVQILTDLIPCKCPNYRMCGSNDTERYELRHIIKELGALKERNDIAPYVSVTIIVPE